MLIFLSPAKSLDFTTPPHVATFTQPGYLQQSETLIRQLRQLSPADIARLMDLSDHEDFDCIPVPVGYTIDDKSKSKAHIDDEDITKKSTELTTILDRFTASAEKAEYIFAHNLNYNENVLGAEYVQTKKTINMFSKKRYCLMEEGTYYCKIPSKGGGYIYPTSAGIAWHLFWSDLRTCRQCKGRCHRSCKMFYQVEKDGKTG